MEATHLASVVAWALILVYGPIFRHPWSFLFLDEAEDIARIGRGISQIWLVRRPEYRRVSTALGLTQREL